MIAFSSGLRLDFMSTVDIMHINHKKQSSTALPDVHLSSAIVLGHRIGAFLS